MTSCLDRRTTIRALLPIVACAWVSLAAPPAQASLVPRLARITIHVKTKTSAKLKQITPSKPDLVDDGHGIAKRSAAAQASRAAAKNKRRGQGGVWRLILTQYPNDVYRQLLKQAGAAKIGVRLVERRKDRLTIHLSAFDGDRVMSIDVKAMPPRLVIDIGPESFNGGHVHDLEVPFTLTKIDLPPIEPVLQVAEYPRAALVLPGAKSYNAARRKLRMGNLNGADDDVTDYLDAYPAGRLASVARYMYGEIQHRLARGALVRDSLRSARVNEAAIKRDPKSPFALRARLMLARDLGMAGMQADAATLFADTEGLVEDSEMAHTFRVGGAALAAGQGDVRRAREMLTPLWRDQVTGEIAALTRMIEAGILYQQGSCERVVPMLAAAIRLHQSVSDRYPEVDMMLAECLTKQGKFEQANELFGAIVRRDPPVDVYPAARVRQGDILFYSGQVAAARSDWLEVMAKFHAGEALGMARMRLALEPRTRAEIAHSLLEEAAQASDTGGHEARFRMAVLTLRRGEWMRAVHIAEKLINEPAAKQFHSRAGNIRSWAMYQIFAAYWRNGDDEGMADTYLKTRKWLRTHPSALRLHRAVAKAFKALQLPDQMVKSLQSALGRYEGTAGERSLLMDLAEAYISTGDGFRAGRIVKYLETYVMPKSKSLRLAEVKARAFAASDRPNEAVVAFRRAVKLAKTKTDKRRLMAWEGDSLRGSGRLAEAVAVYKRCRKLARSKEFLRAPHTPSADCYFGLGGALFGMGRWKAAAAALSKAADHHPDDRRRTTARSQAGLAYRRAHMLEPALDQFKKLQEAAEAQASAALDPDGIAGPGVADGESAQFWNRIATRSAEDTRWDVTRAPQFQRLMETHE